MVDLRRFDVYRKIPKDLKEDPTNTGAIISLCCCFFITFLFFSELFAYLSLEVVSELYVESSENDSNEKIAVQLNITLPKLSCSAVGLDIQDDMGRHEVGFVENTNKIVLNEGKGCRFEGKFYINKVPGNFHVSTHSAANQPADIDMSHFIDELMFGDDVSQLGLTGGFNTLRGKDKTNVQAIESHEYHMKIVPTIYEDNKGTKLQSFQYTSAYKSFLSFHHTGRMMPAIWFRYDLNPITVKYSRRRKHFYTFLTSVCAIIGGTCTVASLIYSIIFTTSKYFRKHEIGKLS
ncbi:endoplasmic reticulum-Golgi intermediate compartment protein 1 [Tetranychus urticae]|uniref:endoplasmic reticulum-Golgi intermediate compartment protein 1 n=1 Tax=Tetranychus urticae TaxID=32264 RepID=UPI00077BAC43|nr:endoplasmic reticulum-Golgi intermediate compartment protein 1 [Tetranychus urticae]